MKTQRRDGEEQLLASRYPRQAGIALFGVLSFMAVVMIICGALFLTAQSHVRAMRALWTSDRCLLIAQSAMEDAKTQIDSTFRTFYNSPFLGGTQFRWSRLDWFDSPTASSIGRDGYYYVYPQDVAYGPTGEARIWIDIENSRFVDLSSRELIVTARARIGDVQRTVTEVVRYGLAKSRVFDYAYFINNFGWFYGTPIYANGDVRANGNFAMQSGPTVNGDIYAGVNPALGAPGTVTGGWVFKLLSEYFGSAPLRARPGSPPSSTYDGNWAMGYPGTSAGLPGREVLEMPYLGSLLEYEYLSAFDNGTLSQGGNVIISNVYSGPGPDSTEGTADDKTIVLNGTKANPIVLDGPVVVQGDLVIKGYVTGQGTIYAGRNIHIADDIYYLNPPTWTKPNANPEAAATLNQTKDFLGLAAKGNVIFGNYTHPQWLANVSSYIKPNFTQAYNTDASDASIGYDSDKNSGNGYRFNGDYTALDGGAKLNDSGGSVTNRRYYESSLSLQNFSNFCGHGASVSNVDGVIYNNHLVTGYVPQGLTVNGAIVSRDEGIIFGNSVRFNWDIRLGSDSAEAIPTDFYLPRTLAEPETRYWKEGDS